MQLIGRRRQPVPPAARLQQFPCPHSWVRRDEVRVRHPFEKLADPEYVLRERTRVHGLLRPVNDERLKPGRRDKSLREPGILVRCVGLGILVGRHHQQCQHGEVTLADRHVNQSFAMTNDCRPTFEERAVQPDLDIGGLILIDWPRLAGLSP